MKRSRRSNWRQQNELTGADFRRLKKSGITINRDTGNLKASLGENPFTGIPLMASLMATPRSLD